ncbi:MAG: hormogonium polysaccharide biosynthesis glycosyltransferase HpsE [Cyanobacteria bacterium J06598_3]
MPQLTSPDFSVVICTYNGAHLLPNLLEKLRQQQPCCSEGSSEGSFEGKQEGSANALASFRWEVIVVDNNSCDAPTEGQRQRTAAVIKEIQQTWRPDVPLRYLFEPQQGLAFARRCAVHASNSELLGFLDDDTLPDPHWVAEAIRFAQQHPRAGAYGSSIHGLYEVPPPPNFERIACCLAIIDRGESPFQYPPNRGVLPAGAGMVIRRQAWLEQVPNVPALAGVKAGSLKAKGEDVETLSYIRRTWEIWHNPAMRLGHVIPKARLERAYLLNLFWQIGLSRYQLRQVQHSWWQWPTMLLLYCANDFRKVLQQLVRSTTFKDIVSHTLGTNAVSREETHLNTVGLNTVGLNTRGLSTVEACELSLLMGSFLSPVFGFIQLFYRGGSKIMATLGSRAPNAKSSLPSHSEHHPTGYPFEVPIDDSLNAPFDAPFDDPLERYAASRTGSRTGSRTDSRTGNASPRLTHTVGQDLL